MRYRRDFYLQNLQCLDAADLKKYSKFLWCAYRDELAKNVSGEFQLQIRKL